MADLVDLSPLEPETGAPLGGLVQVLLDRARQDPDAPALRFLPPGHQPGDAGIAVNRGELRLRADRLAGVLAGTRQALILAPPGPQFVVAVLGCLRAGVTAITCPPPQPGRVSAFVSIARDAEVDAVITVDEATEDVQRSWRDGQGPSDVRWIAMTSLPARCAAPGEPPGPDEVALLQYTSGSTGTPKAVVVTHRNLAAQLANFAALSGLPEGGGVVSWMPVYHALGLGHLLLALYRGGEAVFMTPDDFVAQPYRWLRAISDRSAPVLGGGPNFAYQRCVDLISADQRDSLDLGNWHAALIGGERIQPGTLEQFLATFGPAGLRPMTLFPAYGLTETMQIVVGRLGPAPIDLAFDAAALERGTATPSTPDAATAHLVGCGPQGPYSQVLIVDPETRRPLAADQVGEVWVRGEVVCAGYWRRPEQTAETFGARLADGAGPFLRTGDLAFRHDGDLVVCGRLKELVIINGRNLHPQDIEASAAQADPALAGQRGAAFSVDTSAGEQLVVVQAVSTEDGLDTLAGRILRAVAVVHEVEAAEVLLVHPEQIPVTPSGKVQRAACRQAWLDGTLSPLARVRRTDPDPGAVTADGPADAPALRTMLDALDPPMRAPVVAAEVRRRIAAALAVPVADVPLDEPLVGLGMESVRAIGLRYEIERDFAVRLPAADFLNHPVPGLAQQIADQIDLAAAPTIEWPELVPGPRQQYAPFPLTEIQHAYLVGRSSSYDLGGTSIHLYAEHHTEVLDLPRLRSALHAMVCRHDALRSVISANGYQQVLENPPVPEVIEYDHTGSGPDELDAHLTAVRAELDHQVLPLDDWPMFDVRVTWLPGRAARVHVSLDLLAFDVASVRLFFLEWGQLYQDPDAPLPPVDVTFRDFVCAAAGLRQTTVYERSREYWLARVAALPPAPQLPTTRQGTDPGGVPRRRRRRGRLDPEQWAELRRQATQFGVTPSAVLLAVYATTLGYWSGSSHFSIDVPLFTRYPLHPNIDRVLGDFTSVTLLEVDLRPSDGIAGLARRLQSQLWRDLEHRFFTGVEVIREAAAAQGLPASAFASVVFASVREHGHDQAFEGGEWGARWLGEQVYAITQTPQVLIDNQVYEDRGALGYNWDAVEDRFPAGVLDEMVDAYHRLLVRLGAGQGWATAERMALPSRHAALINAANDTAGPLPDEYLYTGAVRNAGTRPDAPAVIAADARLSFGELYRHALLVGARLRAGGARPNQCVAVAMDKSAAQVVAVLAVQLAGAAYLPVDPGLPAARVRHLLRHGEVRHVLTRADGPAVELPDGVDVIRVDLSVRDPAPPAWEPPQSTDDLAYVLYTSGSTGEPKGVMQTHRATLNTLLDANGRMAVGPDDRALGLSRLSFDLSVWDVFGVLGAGACLVLPEPDAERDPQRWLELLAAHRVTLWNSVPALIQMLVEHVADTVGSAPHPALAQLREVWLSGDWIPVALPDRIRAVAPRAQVTASGGPTESAIWCVANPLGAIDTDAESIPYGRPMRNHVIQVLNDRLEPCPLWVPGEMYIGGAGLATGYWQDPQRTADVFVTDPVTGNRLYRSGDLGRWLPDGQLEILGRRDHQVKISGWRIELGEIESVLTRHPDVAGAVVTTVGDGRDQQRLVAVVAPRTGPTGPSDAVDQHGYLADLGHVVVDPIQRLEFKSRRLGRRTDLSGAAIELPRPARPVPTHRASVRRFDPAPVPLSQLSELLAQLSATDSGELPKFAYGSAGSLYPVQTYLYVAEGRVAGLAGGTYYYDPDAHGLRTVHTGITLPVDLHVPDNQPIAEGAAFWLVLVAQQRAIAPLYGQRSRDFCLIEAGLIAELLEQAAPAARLGLCQLGLIRDAADLRQGLALDDDHQVLHGLVGGTPARPDRTAADTGTDGAQPDQPLAQRLHQHLAAQLPAYMVPMIVLAAAGLPLDQRGKVDRRAAATLAERGAGQPAAQVPPAGDLERSLAAVFARALGVERISVEDRFFDIGANSVVVVRVHRAIATELRLTFPLMAMFEHPSVRRLARYLEDRDRPDGSARDGFARGRRRGHRRRGRPADGGKTS
jgi:amino acid adenylation domain-containing protein